MIVNDKEHLETSYILKQVPPYLFYYAARRYGWRATAVGLWPANEGNPSLSQWLESQTSFYNASDVIKAIGYTREWASKKARKFGLKLATVTNGKWQPDAVALLLEKMGIKATCAKCGGLAAVGKEGAVTCLDCKN